MAPEQEGLLPKVVPKTDQTIVNSYHTISQTQSLPR